MASGVLVLKRPSLGSTCYFKSPFRVVVSCHEVRGVLNFSLHFPDHLINSLIVGRLSRKCLLWRRVFLSFSCTLDSMRWTTVSISSLEASRGRWSKSSSQPRASHCLLALFIPSRHFRGLWMKAGRRFMFRFSLHRPFMGPKKLTNCPLRFATTRFLFSRNET